MIYIKGHRELHKHRPVQKSKRGRSKQVKTESWQATRLNNTRHNFSRLRKGTAAFQKNASVSELTVDITLQDYDRRQLELQAWRNFCVNLINLL